MQSSNLLYYTHTCLTALFRDYLGEWVSRYQKRKINLDFTEARDSEWQWHQLDHITSLQTDNHASTPPLRPNALPATQPAASKHRRSIFVMLIIRKFHIHTLLTLVLVLLRTVKRLCNMKLCRYGVQDYWVSLICSCRAPDAVSVVNVTFKKLIKLQPMALYCDPQWLPVPSSGCHHHRCDYKWQVKECMYADLCLSCVNSGRS